VRVEHRRERQHSEAAQALDEGVFLVAVGDGPRGAEPVAGLVEERPDLGEHPARHEVRVHVDETGQPEPRSVGRDVSVVGRRRGHGVAAVASSG
jgi:hypothetical protein